MRPAGSSSGGRTGTAAPAIKIPLFSGGESGAKPLRGDLPSNYFWVWRRGLGNLRNASNAGFCNANCRNELGRANWNYGSCKFAKVPFQQGQEIQLNASSCALFEQALIIKITSAECAKWLDKQDGQVGLLRLRVIRQLIHSKNRIYEA